MVFLGLKCTALKTSFSYMEKLQDEDVAELMQKREAQLILKQEVDEINRQALLQRERRAEQEKIQDLKVRAFLSVDPSPTKSVKP